MISALTKNKIQILRRKGFSHRQIAKKLNVSSGTVVVYSKEIILTEQQKYKLKMQTTLGASMKLKIKWGIKGGKLTKFRIKYTKEKLLELIRNFYLENGRIPTKREFNSHWQSYRRVFNSWNNAIEEAGFEQNPILFAKKYSANDGHKCDSLSEKIIDDWFNARKIDHKINYPYPGKDGFTVDFKVNDFWIEFFGLDGELKSYDLLKNRKLKLVKKYNLKLIKIYPSGLFPESKLDSILSFLLK